MQARNMAMTMQEQAVKPEYLLRDHDSKFTKMFDEILETEGLEVIKVGPRAPNMNAFMERWLLTLQVECLDHFIVFGEDHLRLLVVEFLAFYNQSRPHQSKDNLPLSGSPTTSEMTPTPDQVVCRQRLGGLLNHYERRAA